MKTIKIPILFLLITGSLFTSCNDNKTKEKKEITKKEAEFTIKKNSDMGNDTRISLKLNEMQKNHQKKIMRDHLDAIQSLVSLLASDKYEEASKLAYKRLGSTTKMKLMCASFGDKNFEKLGIEFHKSADKMSDIIKKRNKEQSLKALSNTMHYCVQCHTTYRQ